MMNEEQFPHEIFETRTEEAFFLVRVEGKTYAETAEIMGVKPASVRTYLWAFLDDRKRIEKRNERNRRYNRQHYLKINGEYVRHKKEPRPKLCQLCGEHHARDYHHWHDQNGAIKGIWVCMMCHRVCEGVEKDLHTKYKEIKKGLNGE